MFRTEERVNIPALVGSGYGAFWRFKGRYRVVKGSRRSKKSTTTALWVISHMMKYPEANTLVVRRVYRTMKDSCFTQLKWAANRLKVLHLWEFKESPLEATYKPTGQKIYFRGLDDPLKIASITCETGVLCWMWIEEAYEITSMADFDTLLESMLGDCPPDLWKQVTLTFNPWNQRHWLKARFFDEPDQNTLALTTNYQCNEWLSDADKEYFDELRKKNPRRYKVAGLGDWGIVEGVIYENFQSDQRFTLEEINEKYNLETMCGLDFGYTNDPSAFVVLLVDRTNKVIFVWDEIYEKGLSNEQIFRRIESRGYAKERIIADSAEPKSIDELRRYGLRIRGALKGKDSINHGIQYLQGFRIVIHERCVNFNTEIQNYTWDKDRLGNTLNRPIDDFNHLMDAMRYATESGHSHKINRTLQGGI